MELPVRKPVSNARKISYRLETRNLSYIIQNDGCRKNYSRVILKDVNCEAIPGDITAIAGPSGAGKTTLLEILAANISPRKISGEVLINGDQMNPEAFRRVSGYVTQDDSLFPLLTVRETLMYSALLRLQGGRIEAGKRVSVLLNELSLEHISESRIGKGSNRGISGGERRRVSIGVELVHDPNVVLLDEPTSGLDSASAFHIISILKLMAIKLNREKTIILTIHQPGYRILELFDRLVLLSSGCVVHNGSVQLLEERLHFSGHRIPCHVNVLEFSVDISDHITIHYTPQNLHRPRKSSSKEDKHFAYTNSNVSEILILGQRFFQTVFRTKQLFATRVIQSLLSGIILGTIYMNICEKQEKQARLGFFAFTLTFLLSSTTEGLPIFLQERRIFTKETSRGAYRVSSYVIANTIVFIPFLLMVSVLYSTPVYWLAGLRQDFSSFIYFTLIVWMVVLMANSFTACLSALVPNFITGTSIIAGLMGSFFLFSGYFISKEKIPIYWKFMHYLSLFKYPFECFLINEYGGEGGSGILEQQGLVESQKWSNLGVMFGYIIGYRVLSYLILRCRYYRSKN